jgi:ABC-2 type transport system ATP-binding protein
MHALAINNLVKTYSTGVTAVNQVSLTVEQGDFFALLGPNGAGKTTIIGIISSLVNKTSGEVSVFGHDIDKDRFAAKLCMGLVPQEINFNQFERVFEIVVNQAGFYGISRKLAMERAEKYLQQLGLWHKHDQMARTLSGGMKRRLMIARALVHEPKLLILDEPTAGVDIELRRSTWEFLQQINQQGTTIILTTHYLEEAESLCQGVAIIDKGRIIEWTRVKSLLAQLQSETILLDLKSPLSGVLLSPQLLGLENVQIHLRDESTLEITYPKHTNLNAIFSALAQHGLYVHSMRNKANRLEELFLNRISRHGGGV